MNEPIEKCQVYRIRWLILAIFVMYSCVSAMQWIQYSIITDVVIKYYGVSAQAVNWTSMIYMVLYIIFIFPGSYLLDRLGLRLSVITGILVTCAGTWIKVASVSPDRFWVGFLGQTIVASGQVFILSVPARLAAVWFGPNQVSSACSIGVFGNQLGVALGFLFPSLIVDSKGNKENISRDFYVMFITMGIISTIILFLILFFFKDAPPSPPSLAQKQANEEKINFIKSVKALLFNRSYVLLLIAYGINVGIFYAISTLLNQVILKYYSGASADAGRIGLLITVAGMFGSIAFGFVLDKYHKFKETTLVVYEFSLISMVIYTFTLGKGLVVVYLVSALLGFFMIGLLPVGFEMAAELTYPEPEGTSAGFLSAASEVFGIIFTSIYSILFENYGDTWANSFMSAMLVIGTVMTAFIQSDLRRQAAQLHI